MDNQSVSSLDSEDVDFLKDADEEKDVFRTKVGYCLQDVFRTKVDNVYRHTLILYTIVLNQNRAKVLHVMKNVMKRSI